MESVERLHHAETSTLVVRLELANLRYELQYIDAPALREALRDAQAKYEAQLDILANLLQLFTPARYRRAGIDVDKTMGRQLQDVMNAREEKKRAYYRWWRGTRQAENLRSFISVAEAELLSLQAVEHITREDCYAPMVQLA